MENQTPEQDGLYIINGTSKVLYYQDGEWFKPIKTNKRYSGYIAKLDKQPRVKSFTEYKTRY